MYHETCCCLRQWKSRSKKSWRRPWAGAWMSPPWCGGENRSAATQVVQKDLFDLTPQDLAGYDVVVDAFGAWTETPCPSTAPPSSTCATASAAPAPACWWWGAPAACTPTRSTRRCSRTGPGFPAEFLPLAQAQGKALEALRTRNDVQWTFLSPAADFQPEGGPHREIHPGREEFTCNAKGESVISYADYAIALVDEAVSGAHPQARISVVGSNQRITPEKPSASPGGPFTVRPGRRSCGRGKKWTKEERLALCVLCKWIDEGGFLWYSVRRSRRQGASLPPEATERGGKRNDGACRTLVAVQPCGFGPPGGAGHLWHPGPAEVPQDPGGPACGRGASPLGAKAVPPAPRPGA